MCCRRSDVETTDYTDETDFWSPIRVIRSKNAKKTYIVLKFYVFLQYKTSKMKSNMSQTTTMSIRVDSNLKRRFDVLCDEFGLSNTAALMLFIKAVVRESRIPFEIKTDTIEESRRKALLAFEQMREDVAAAGVQEMTLDEINELIREVRYGKK